MPVIYDIPISLKVKEALHRAGFGRHSNVKPEIEDFMFELLARVKNDDLLEPAVAYEIYPFIGSRYGPQPFGGNGAIPDPLWRSLFLEAEEFAALVCTIGPKLEKQATNYFKQNDPLRGVLLDGIGNAAVDLLAEEVCKLMTEIASFRGYQAGGPISPGMHGLDITEQQRLINMVPAEEIGVSITSSGVMAPLKSISMIIGMGPSLKTWTRADVCSQCNLRTTCLYRREATSEDATDQEQERIEPWRLKFQALRKRWSLAMDNPPFSSGNGSTLQEERNFRKL